MNFEELAETARSRPAISWTWFAVLLVSILFPPTHWMRSSGVLSVRGGWAGFQFLFFLDGNVNISTAIWIAEWLGLAFVLAAILLFLGPSLPVAAARAEAISRAPVPYSQKWYRAGVVSAASLLLLTALTLFTSPEGQLEGLSSVVGAVLAVVCLFYWVQAEWYYLKAKGRSLWWLALTLPTAIVGMMILRLLRDRSAEPGVGRVFSK